MCFRDYSYTALHLVDCVRPPGTHHRRLRRRGPRSAEALLRRAGGLHANASTLELLGGGGRNKEEHVSSMPLGGDSSQSESVPPLFTCCFTIFHCNTRGLFSKLAEINTRIALMLKKPSILCFTETWLNALIGHITIAGYFVVVRRDRDDGRVGGGVLVLVADSILQNLTPILVSKSDERVWCLLYSNIGPMLICCWYRPPSRGDVSSIHSLRQEFLELRDQAISSFIVGDMNVHNINWLLYSRENSPEGIGLQRFSSDYGFRECVRAPTRGKYLLDLVLTDTDASCVCNVLPSVAGHFCVYVEFDMPVTIPSPNKPYCVEFWCCRLENNV